MVKSFVSTDPQQHQSENTWFTPKWLIDSLGPFDLDPCTVSYRPFDTASISIERDLGQCGLSSNWKGLAWVNPPYGKEIEPFIEKMIKHGNCIGLVFARMGTNWMQEWLRSGGGIFFLRKRVRFMDKHGQIAKANPGVDSCLLYLGDLAYQRILNSGIEGEFR